MKKDKFTNIRLQSKNIIAIYDQSSQGEKIEGKAWYKNANNLCRVMSEKYNLTLPQVVGIISALSPGTNWNQNVIDANTLCSLLGAGKDIRSITCTTYHRNKLKASYLWLHSELSEGEIFTILLDASKKVNKTSSFYLNILHPELSDNVTIDRHSCRVNLGVTVLPDQRLTEKKYKAMESAYKSASSQLQISAIELQAITWITFRRINNIIRDKQFEVVPF